VFGPIAIMGVVAALILKEPWVLTQRFEERKLPGGGCKRVNVCFLGGG
jgi:hypothetical protein